MELETAETCLSGVLDGILSIQEAEQCIVNRRVRGNKCGTSVISDVWTLALTYICMEDMCVCVCAVDACDQCVFLSGGERKLYIRIKRIQQDARGS